MGHNNEGAARVVFDIETAPIADAAIYIEPAEAPGNYKDPVKIASYIADETARKLERCGLDVDLCRVVAIGYQLEGGEVRVLTADEEGEAGALRLFWSLVGNRHLVGFNILSFDLPVLLRRSLYLGVEAPHIQLDKFKHPQVTDLMQVLSYNGLLNYRGLSFYSRRFGFGIEDNLTGADIALAVREGRYLDIERHVTADIQKTAALAERLGMFHLEPAAVL